MSYALGEFALGEAGTTGGEAVLTIASAASTQTIENVQIIQQHNLQLGNIDQAQTIDALVLTQNLDLTIQDLASTQTLENVVVDTTFNSDLVVQDGTQSQTIENLDLEQSYLLTTADLLQLQIIDNVTLMQAHIIYVSDLAQPQSIASVNLLVGAGQTFGPAVQSG